MYAVLLARASTGRDRIMKAGGGWHGAQPWALKGVDFHGENHSQFQHVETKGLPLAIAREVLVTRFNDPEMLEGLFRRHGGEVACFIVEPFMGAGGFLFAEPEYLALARELCTRNGTVLIFDEVISGFRFHPGAVSHLYGVQPDLATFAKAMGGGMPVAAVAGRAELMKMAGRGGGVKFSGGTYSGHPACMLAARTMMAHLESHAREIYPRLAVLGERTRRAVEAAFASEGLHAACTGDGNRVVPGSSLAMVHFPYREATRFRSPEDTHNPDVCDVALSETVVQMALLLEDVFVVHGLGSLTRRTRKAPGAAGGSLPPRRPPDQCLALAAPAAQSKPTSRVAQPVSPGKPQASRRITSDCEEGLMEMIRRIPSSSWRSSSSAKPSGGIRKKDGVPGLARRSGNRTKDSARKSVFSAYGRREASTSSPRMW
jgi:glutamate-1-semialdehyde 2,1-aminomutase